MPYIKQERREYLQRQKASELGRTVASPGELNYIITKIVFDFLTAIPESYSYQDLNEIIGVLESAKKEFYRRIVAPYEDRKIEENGDVYE